MLLRGGVVRHNLSEHSFHFAENPNRSGNKIGIAVAFTSRDQRALAIKSAGVGPRMFFFPISTVFLAATELDMSRLTAQSHEPATAFAVRGADLPTREREAGASVTARKQESSPSPSEILARSKAIPEADFENEKALRQ